MKFLFDLFPILLFFVAYHIAGIYAATATAMIATLGQIGWLRLRKRKIEPMLWVSFAIITLFGGATLWLHNETFIKWKPTVLYWFFGIALWVASRIYQHNLVRKLINTPQLRLPEAAWQRLNDSWIVFFVVMGAVNLWVAYQFSTDTWVSFKLFGSIILTLVFVVLQGIFLAKHMKQNHEP
jgi:intracellular septation protein